METVNSKDKAKARVCKTNGCYNTIRPNRRGMFCNTCRSIKQRAVDPMLTAYRNKRTNARRKGKIFTISFEYFKKFCYDYNYIVNKGRSKMSFGIDCVRAELGYVEGNIRALPNTINSKKHTKKVTFDWICREFRAIGLEPPSEDNFDEGFEEN